jgi:hypothetical protein
MILFPTQVRTMSSFIYPTDQQIVEPLTKSIDYFHKAFGTSLLYPLPPTVDQLRELLNCSFAASLETEEGRCVAFTVSFFADRDCNFAYRLREPLRLSPRDLVRLAVALDPSQARICVIAGNTSLEIAGLIHLGEQDSFHGGRQTLSQLSIRVLGPGILLVRYGNVLLFTYRRGRFAFHAGVSVKVEEHAVGNLLSLRRHPGNAEELQETLGLEAALKRISRSMLRQRHGGTILILPDDVDWEIAASSKRYAPTSPVNALKNARVQNREHTTKRNEAFQQLLQGQANPEMAQYWADDMIRSHFASELEWLSRLTATDGMTVIRPDLTLLGFGVFFDTQEDDGSRTRVVIIDPYDDGAGPEPQALASIGGARHQSSAVTCRRLPGATAIVASQDGSLSSMRRDDKEDVVVVYRHLELLFDV